MDSGDKAQIVRSGACRELGPPLPVLPSSVLGTNRRHGGIHRVCLESKACLCQLNLPQGSRKGIKEEMMEGEEMDGKEERRKEGKKT